MARFLKNVYQQIILLTKLDAFIAKVCITDIMNTGEASPRGHFDSILRRKDYQDDEVMEIVA